METSAEPMVQVWFGDANERELREDEKYLAVYAAGGGKRNMANFVRTAGGPAEEAGFRTSDVHLYLSPDAGELFDQGAKLFVCRYASSRGEWVPKPITAWQPGQQQLKLIPEWFKARFWDNKQEKKHPWFMFGFLCEAPDGSPRFFTSTAFPVHQYYPTGLKKTDPNEATCRAAFHRVLKQAPSSTLRPATLLRRAGGSIAAFPGSQSLTPGVDRSGALIAKPRPQPKGYGGYSPSSASVSDGSADMEMDDDDSDEYDHKRMHPHHHAPMGQYNKQWANPNGDYGEQVANIGQNGLDAVEALLALRGFGPMR